MTDAHTLDDTINKAAFWSAIVLILAGVLSVFFPHMIKAGIWLDVIAIIVISSITCYTGPILLSFH